MTSSYNDIVVPHVVVGCSTSIPSQWVLHQVKVHQHPKGEALTIVSKWGAVELWFLA